MFQIPNYQRVSRRQPFISVALQGVNLKKVVPVEDEVTKLVVSRVGKEYETLELGLLEQVGTKLTFAATEELLSMPGGRYSYKLYYLGNYVGTKQFILEVAEVEIVSV